MSNEFHYVNSYSYYKRKRGNKLGLLVLILIGGFAVYWAFQHFIQGNVKENSALVSALKDFGGGQTLGETTQDNNDLKAVVENALAGTQGKYGIVIKNLKTGESYYSNEHQVFQPGSLYKVWVMATAYKQIQEGSLKEDEELTEDVQVLNDKFNISSDTADLTEGTVDFSVDSALTQMITISHNYAALLLTERVRLSKIAEFLQQNGFKESTVGTDGSAPTSTPSDIALFFEKLYKGELANPEYTDKMLNLLKAQKLNDKLPKYLPDEAVVAHKTGEIDNFSHDGGIVYTPKGDYIIVVLSESDSPPGAEERIAEVSKAVYEYFSKS